MEVRIDLAAERGSRATFRVSYTVRGARWAPLYDARLDSGTRERKPALELVRRAEIVQQTGEDWSDVALSVSTVRTAKGGSAPELRPLIVRYPQPVPARDLAPRCGSPRPGARRSRGPASAASEADNVDRRRPASRPRGTSSEATVETGGYQAVFRVPGRMSVATNEGAKSFRISTAQDRTRSPGARDARARRDRVPRSLVQACRRSAAAARPRRALSRRHLRRTRPDGAHAEGRDLRLGFGADDKVKVARASRARSKARPGSSRRPRPTSASTRSRCAAATSGRSGSMVEDQVPTSEIAEIQVEMLPGHDAADRARRARPARRARLELRCRARRGQGDQARLAAALARRQGRRLRAAPALRRLRPR